MDELTDEHGRELYVCPKCGRVDHDQQDGTGFWEQGTSSHDDDGWSPWTLLCRCGEISDMPLATPEDVRAHAARYGDPEERKAVT